MELSAVDLLSCQKLAGTTEPFIFVLERGVKIVDSLVKMTEATKIKSASLFGMAGFDDPVLGFFDIEQKSFIYKKFEGFYEVGSLVGNITTLNGEIIIHLHAVLGLKDYSAITGHLQDATISVTAEISVIPHMNSINRKYNPYLKYNLITP